MFFSEIAKNILKHTIISFLRGFSIKEWNKEIVVNGKKVKLGDYLVENNVLIIDYVKENYKDVYNLAKNFLKNRKDILEKLTYEKVLEWIEKETKNYELVNLFRYNEKAKKWLINNLEAIKNEFYEGSSF
jgi:DNA-directed RNA polymerase beta' subunit